MNLAVELYKSMSSQLEIIIIRQRLYLRSFLLLN